MTSFISHFGNIDFKDLPKVGGKNAFLGDIFHQLSVKGVQVPDGFAVTAAGYWSFLKFNGLHVTLPRILNKLDTASFSNLEEIGKNARNAISEATLPYPLQVQVAAAYHQLQGRLESEFSVAVRSSTAASKYPHVNFSGMQESYTNVGTDDHLLATCLKCYASLFTNRAIKHRVTKGIKHTEVALSIGIQQMVRADLGCTGVGYITGKQDNTPQRIVVKGTWGLGNHLQEGQIEPDEFILYQHATHSNDDAPIEKKLGSKEKMFIYFQQNDHITTTQIVETPKPKRNAFILRDKEIQTLAHWSVIVNNHYRQSMNIEWAKDGLTDRLYLMQAHLQGTPSVKQVG